MANGIISYSVTSENNTIKTELLPHYSSVLSSELIAIHEAVKIEIKIPGKHDICSDSLSALKSLTNSNNHSYYPWTIRNLVSNHFQKIILIWIRSHIGITITISTPLPTPQTTTLTTYHTFWKNTSNQNKLKCTTMYLLGTNKSYRPHRNPSVRYPQTPIGKRKYSYTDYD